MKKIIVFFIVLIIISCMEIPYVYCKNLNGLELGYVFSRDTESSESLNIEFDGLFESNRVNKKELEIQYQNDLFRQENLYRNKGNFSLKNYLDSQEYFVSLCYETMNQGMNNVYLSNSYSFGVGGGKINNFYGSKMMSELVIYHRFFHIFIEGEPGYKKLTLDDIIEIKGVDPASSFVVPGLLQHTIDTWDTILKHYTPGEDLSEKDMYISLRKELEYKYIKLYGNIDVNLKDFDNDYLYKYGISVKLPLTDMIYVKSFCNIDRDYLSREQIKRYGMNIGFIF